MVPCRSDSRACCFGHVVAACLLTPGAREAREAQKTGKERKGVGGAGFLGQHILYHKRHFQVFGGYCCGVAWKIWVFKNDHKVRGNSEQIK